MQEPLILYSANRCVRVEFQIQTCWLGATVYPQAATWRIWFHDKLVVDTSLIGLNPRSSTQPLLCGLHIEKTSRHRKMTPIGPGRECVVQAAVRHTTQQLVIRLRVTDQSAFCEVRRYRARSTEGDTPIFLTNLPPGSTPLSAAGERPCVAYSASGKLLAYWSHACSQHLVFFDRPGDLLPRTFNVHTALETLVFHNGSDACTKLFQLIPFTKAALPEPRFGEALTPAAQRALQTILARAAQADDFWVIRGEPGVFAVTATRKGACWHVAGITASARTLTIRFEDLALRTPTDCRAEQYAVRIQRDPNKHELGTLIDETFDAQPAHIRVALDLAPNGGFLLTFTPTSLK